MITKTGTTSTVVHRKHAVRCKVCLDTGIIDTMVPRYIGRASDGSKVYNPHHLVLARTFCHCGATGKRVTR